MRLQLCDTAGQVSITSLLSAGRGKGLLKPFTSPPRPSWAILEPHPHVWPLAEGGGRGRELRANKTGFGPALCGQDRGNRVKSGSYLLGMSDLIYFLVFIKNYQCCVVLISQSKLAVAYDHFIKGQQAKYLINLLKKKMEFMSVSVNVSLPKHGGLAGAAPIP